MPVNTGVRRRGHDTTRYVDWRALGGRCLHPSAHSSEEAPKTVFGILDEPQLRPTEDKKIFCAGENESALNQSQIDQRRQAGFQDWTEESIACVNVPQISGKMKDGFYLDAVRHFLRAFTDSEINLTSKEYPGIHTSTSTDTTSSGGGSLPIQ
eukprot:151811-Rhodomonas_salina.1